jgi:soluble lytic murein transglycosylase
LAKEIIKKLPKSQAFSSAELSVAIRNPRRYLEMSKLENSHKGRHTVALFALQRLSKQSPQIAYTQWESIGKYFSEEEQRYFFGWLGLAGAQSHDERALTWFSAAGDAALNAKQLAWRTRAALRAQNWHEVWASIDAMSPQQQGEGVWRYWKARALKVLGRSVEAERFYRAGRQYNFYELASSWAQRRVPKWVWRLPA